MIRTYEVNTAHGFHSETRGNAPKRKALFYRGHRWCAYCGVALGLNAYTKNPLTIDHVIPLSLGGEDSERNITSACYPCNQAKGAVLIKPSFDTITGKPL